MVPFIPTRAIPFRSALAAGALGCLCASWSSVASAANDIGVIKGQNGCPSGAEEIEFRMDNEDSNHNSHGSWLGGIVSNSNTTLRFCRVDGDKFAPKLIGGTFAVLSLASSCPAGGKLFHRYFDDEDDKNRDGSSGNIFPNVHTHNIRLDFCLYSNPIGFWLPSLGVEYGVFGTRQGLPSLPADAFSYLVTDDENDANVDAIWFDWTTDPNDSLATLARSIVQPYNVQTGTAEGSCEDEWTCWMETELGPTPCNDLSQPGCECEPPENTCQNPGGPDTKLNIARVR